jgi:hypothetical protein
MPQIGTKKRFAEMDTYPQVFAFYFHRPRNSFEAEWHPTILVNKPYEKLVMREIRCEWDTGSKILLENKEYNIKWEHYEEQDGFYIVMYPMRRNDLLEINFEKVFVDKEIGEIFDARFILSFSFNDGELEGTEVFECKITVLKGEYQSPPPLWG